MEYYSHLFYNKTVCLVIELQTGDWIKFSVCLAIDACTEIDWLVDRLNDRSVGPSVRPSVGSVGRSVNPEATSIFSFSYIENTHKVLPCT